MSRMSKYLNQRATLEVIQRDEMGQPIKDAYGKYSYEAPVTVRCRREVTKSVASTGNGLYISYSYTYYIDETIKVSEGDRIDGYEVQRVAEYVDGAGVMVGYEVHV